jgi:hypothetical protein
MRQRFWNEQLDRDPKSVSSHLEHFLFRNKIFEVPIAPQTGREEIKFRAVDSHFHDANSLSQFHLQTEKATGKSQKSGKSCLKLKK